MAEPSPPPPARRFRAADVAELLDMQTLGEVLAGVTLDGWRQVAGNLLADRSGHRAALLAALAAAAPAPGSEALEALRLRAHALKGNAASLGLRAIQHAAAEVERQWKDDADRGDGPAAAAERLALAWDDSSALLARMGLL